MDGLPAHALSYSGSYLWPFAGEEAATHYWGTQVRGSQKSSKNEAKVEEDGGTAKGKSFLEWVHSKIHQWAKDCRDNLARLFPGKIRVMGVSMFQGGVGPSFYISQQQSPVESRCCYFFYMRRYFWQEETGKLVMNWLVWPEYCLWLTPKEKCAGWEGEN